MQNMESFSIEGNKKKDGKYSFKISETMESICVLMKNTFSGDKTKSTVK